MTPKGAIGQLHHNSRFGTKDDVAQIHKPSKNAESSKENDTNSIIVLLVLYTLQGIPMGLSTSVPLLLASKRLKASFSDQSLFSLITLPFSLKLLWAPVVDLWYCERIGRRKTWMVPVQLVCGLLMVTCGSSQLGSASLIDTWIGTEDEYADVKCLTAFFLILYALMATQDIAVDGWALTMLSRKNRAWASTCNTVGQALGYFSAFAGFMALNDASTCNRLFRTVPSSEPLTTLGSFVAFWGALMLMATVLIGTFKSEGTSIGAEDEEFPIDTSLPFVQQLKEAYKILWDICKITNIQKVMVLLLLVRIPFGATDYITKLKMLQFGMSKEDYAFFQSLLLPVGIVSPMLVGKLVNAKRNSLRVFQWGFVARMLDVLVWIGLSLFCRLVHSTNFGGVKSLFYLLFWIFSATSTVSTDLMVGSQMAFFAHVADPTLGGVYMTFLNTMTNLGSKWPGTLYLCLMDRIGYFTVLDPYYVLATFGFFVGVASLRTLSRRLLELQSAKECSFHLANISQGPVSSYKNK